MTSTPTPPPNYSLVPAPRPAENNRNHNHHNSHKRNKNRWSSSLKYAPIAVVAAAEFGANGSVALAGGVQSVGSGRAASYASALDSLFDGRKSWLPPEFSGRKSTRFAAKMYYGMPRVTPNKHAHSNAADEVIRCLFKAGNNIADIDNILVAYEHKLKVVEDYIYMLKKFSNTGHYCWPLRALILL